MGILSPSTETDVATGRSVRPLYRSDAETAIREVTEEWLRERVAQARLIHEVNMCQGGARVDLLCVAPQRLVGVEIKGPWDNSDRLIHQLAMFRMALPELWLVVAGRMVAETVEIARFLFPSLGVAEVCHSGVPVNWTDLEYRAGWGGGHGRQVDRAALSLRVIHEAVAVEPFWRASLNMLWVGELKSEAKRSRFIQGTAARATHAALVAKLMALSPAEIIEAVCRQLRSRPTLHRADDAVREPAP